MFRCSAPARTVNISAWSRMNQNAAGVESRYGVCQTIHGLAAWRQREGRATNNGVTQRVAWIGTRISVALLRLDCMSGGRGGVYL
jgi:hypothetical protein